MNRIKQLRNEKNIKQDVLANLEVAGVSKLETGRVPLKDEYIIKLSEYFGVSTDYLLGKSDIRNPEKIDENKLNVAFSSGFDGLNDTNKSIVSATIAGLLAKQKEEERNKEKGGKNND